MKKLILFSLFLLAGLTGVNAQIESETITVKAVKKGEEPKAVMDAIKQDFPKAIVDDLSMLPAKLYGEQWSVSRDNRMDGATPDNYLVNLKAGTESFRAVYDKTGKMISMKHFISQAQLPHDITATIASKYPDWTIIKGSEKISYREGLTNDAYRVEIQNNKMRRILFLTDDGIIVRDLHIRNSK